MVEYKYLKEKMVQIMDNMIWGGGGDSLPDFKEVPVVEWFFENFFLKMP